MEVIGEQTPDDQTQDEPTPVADQLTPEEQRTKEEYLKILDEMLMTTEALEADHELYNYLAGNELYKCDDITRDMWTALTFKDVKRSPETTAGQGSPGSRQQQAQKLYQDFLQYLDDTLRSPANSSEILGAHESSEILKQLKGELPKNCPKSEEDLRSIKDKLKGVAKLMKESDDEIELLAVIYMDVFVNIVENKATGSKKPRVLNLQELTGQINEDKVTMVRHTDLAGIQTADSMLANNQREIFWHPEAINVYNALRNFKPGTSKVEGGNSKVDRMELVGPPGCGKSTIAFVLAHNLRAEKNVLWIECGKEKVDVVFMPVGVARVYTSTVKSTELVDHVVKQVPKCMAIFLDGYTASMSTNIPLDTDAFGDHEEQRFVISSMAAHENYGNHQGSVTMDKIIVEEVQYISENLQSEIVKKNQEVRLRFLLSLPKAKIENSLKAIYKSEKDKKETAMKQFEYLIRYKQYYSGVSFRWFTVMSPDQIEKALKKVVRGICFSNFGVGATGDQSSKSMNTVYVQNRQKDLGYRFASKFCMRVVSEAFYSREREKFIEFAKTVRGVKGFVAEHLFWNMLKSGNAKLMHEAGGQDFSGVDLAREFMQREGSNVGQYLAAIEMTMPFSSTESRRLLNGKDGKRFWLRLPDMFAGWDFVQIDPEKYHFVQITTAPKNSLDFAAAGLFIKAFEGNGNKRREIVNFSFVTPNNKLVKIDGTPRIWQDLQFRYAKNHRTGYERRQYPKKGVMTRDRVKVVAKRSEDGNVEEGMVVNDDTMADDNGSEEVNANDFLLQDDGVRENSFFEDGDLDEDDDGTGNSCEPRVDGTGRIYIDAGDTSVCQVDFLCQYHVHMEGITPC